MVSSQFHYTKQNRFMPFLLAEILNFQGSTHRIGVGSFSSKFDSIDPITEESLDFDRYEIKVTNVEISDTIVEFTVEKSMFF